LVDKSVSTRTLKSAIRNADKKWRSSRPCKFWDRKAIAKRRTKTGKQNNWDKLATLLRSVVRGKDVRLCVERLGVTLKRSNGTTTLSSKTRVQEPGAFQRAGGD